MVEIHRILTNMISIYALLLGVWGLVNFLRRRPPDGSYNGALAIAVGLFAVQTLVGLVLVIMGLWPARTIHFLYGVTILLLIPGIFAFTRGRNSARESLLYGFAMLFIWGLTERASETATQAGP